MGLLPALSLCRGTAALRQKAAAVRTSRRACTVVAEVATATKTVKIGTRGSPLALAQAYMTRDLLKVRDVSTLRSLIC